jgi:hypothetical protein
MSELRKRLIRIDLVTLALVAGTAACLAEFDPHSKFGMALARVVLVIIVALLLTLPRPNQVLAFLSGVVSLVPLAFFGLCAFGVVGSALLGGWAYYGTGARAVWYWLYVVAVLSCLTLQVVRALIVATLLARARFR